MSGIWTKNDGRWRAASSRDFESEKELHDLVEDNIGMLPLAGSPRLFVLGREVPLGSGYADLLAVEASGRPVIAEVKLARSPEAKRAIVAQVISYAAFLQGYDVESLTKGPLSKSLTKGPLSKSLSDRDQVSILGMAMAQDQEDEIDSDTFETSLQEYLTNGMFRLVLIMDNSSVELERVIAYLDAVTMQSLTIDLITFRIFDVNGTEVAMPQRISPDLSLTSDSVSGLSSKRASKAILSDGPDAFIASFADIEGESRQVFNQLVNWAIEIGKMQGVNLNTATGVNKNRFTLLPRLASENAGLVTIWNDNSKPYISFWRGVFERRAPSSIEAVEMAAGTRIGHGNTVNEVTPDLLEALKSAYREAIKI